MRRMVTRRSLEHRCQRPVRRASQAGGLKGQVPARPRLLLRDPGWAWKQIQCQRATALPTWT